MDELRNSVLNKGTSYMKRLIRQWRHCAQAMEQVYHENTIEKWTKGCIPQFLEKGDMGITNNYGGVTFTAIAANIYNAMLLN